MTLACVPRVGDDAARTRCAESSRLGSVSRRLSSLLMLAGAVAGLTAAPVHAEGAADAALARQHWVLNCMGCHTATGGGIPGKVPPLANSLGYFTHLPAGREYVMRVPGASNSALSDQDLADVLNWVLTTMNRDALPRDFKPYTAAEVAAHRRPALSDVATVRAGLVRALQARGIDGVNDRY
ncbi:cytochrome C [Burkholderia sp. AU15512]|nr:cytochrome C [Burkholderia sp. AU15512]